MNFIKRYRLLIVGLGLVVLVGGFLAFRPDKLFVDDTVDESLAEAFADAGDSDTPPPPTADSSTPEVTTDEISEPVATSESTTTTTTAVAGPIEISTGDFYGIDHTATGTATVYEQDGRHVLRFEDDTDIQNGPDLYVWVLPAGDYDGGDPTEYLDLGKLKGNIGGQNYELPEGYDPGIHQTVLIWCLRFGVPFAAVPLG
jgi:hypothetical protein